MNLEEALRERMVRPQRHRLLQGFPAVPAMTRAAGARRRRLLDGQEIVDPLGDGSHLLAPEDRLVMPRPEPGVDEVDDVDDEAPRGPVLEIDRSRGLIVGIIPHTQCIPRVDGCGFCTFAHDRANGHARATMVEVVANDIVRVCDDPAIRGRAVDAVYIGGGTANLTSTDEVRTLVRVLGERVDISGAELTLEGVPQLFTTWLGAPLRMLAELPTATKRVSMGIQTFDPHFLTMMGREKIGDDASVRRTIKLCRSHGIATSGDFLFNLPGQSARQMDDDVDRAIAHGLDQICLYNLVLYDGLGTPWSKNAALVAAMPDNDVASANWLRLRDRLLAAGYVQTTLTNFERVDVVSSPARFRYEVDSFSPEAFDGIGIGPMTISTVVDWRSMRGLKLHRRKDLAGTPWSRGDLAFVYDDVSLRALFVVRSLAKTSFSLSTYAQLFSSSFVDDFAAAVQVLRAAALITIDDERCGLTPRGMFFSDAVVGVVTSSTARSGDGVHTRDLLHERPRAADYFGMG